MIEEPYDFLKIDKLNLDSEIVRQAVEYAKQAKLTADARDVLAKAEAKLELVQAQMDKKIRENPSSFDLGEKFTEAMVRSRIIMSKRYQEALQEVNKATYEVNCLQVGVTALDHKKKMIEKGVDLFLSDYWSEPRVKNKP